MLPVAEVRCGHGKLDQSGVSGREERWTDPASKVNQEARQKWQKDSSKMPVHLSQAHFCWLQGEIIKHKTLACAADRDCLLARA